VDLSSLVFVAIIGVWAAYLVPHWLSRRDDLAQSRTPDRFSGGLRVLQRRSRKPRPDRADHRSGDAVLTSPRVVLDADGEYLYIPADRALAARAERRAAEAAAVESAAVAPAVSEPAVSEPADFESGVDGSAVVESVAVESANGWPGSIFAGPVLAEPVLPGPVSAGPDSVGPDSVGPVGDESVDAELIAPESTVAAPIVAETVIVESVAGSGAAEESLVVAEQGPVEGHPPVEIPASGFSSAPLWSTFAPSPQRASGPSASTPEADIPERPSDLEVAIGIARVAARRRARIMALLLVATVVSWVVTSVSSISAWVAVPSTVLLMMHVLASRVAGLRSRETLMMLAVQVQSAELVQTRSQRSFAAPDRPAEVAAPAHTPDRVARRAAAVGAETWEPIPVPPPTYTLKPAAHRPEPAPLDLPAAGTAPAAAVSRGALPRRAADVERILALESHLDDLFEEPKVVNG
jgi:hypothetical protein